MYIYFINALVFFKIFVIGCNVSKYSCIMTYLVQSDNLTFVNVLYFYKIKHKIKYK